LMALAYVAARTSRIKLGTLVLCNTFRHAGQLAREAAALADAAPGRFILGIGAGWYEREYRAFGLPYDHRVSRLEETLRVLRPLLEGGRVSLAGRHLTLDDADVLTSGPAPPIWMGGGGDRMLRLATRYADGWNWGWSGPDVEPFERNLARLRAAGELRPGFCPSICLLALPIEDDERPAVLDHAARFGGPFWNRGEPDERAVIGGPARLAEALRAYERAGASHAILNLAVAPHALMDWSYLDRAAAALPLL
ncbi:MAG TPA: LLM class flavin-dependent oxidoreductase, partial [Candidatus Dormibacteraeota bacterium]|nr:LLM class flavin-dependent oxidoreductase [Candidatus Dormibacteraeota bacterium]